MIKIGDKVQIKGNDLRGNVIIEGTAIVREIQDQDSERTLALVEFDDEPGATYPRFIWSE